ncbi:hypothetical protein L1987_43280 [Smallanthus sonchifolius]|uniref:Uncharacterized protein n=1 Tax=Smallanthus sonchifolius TaxID=185202 RepID=A0ACB9GM72_9ASTR|nr:hypothetical protein L1987_43280 [Smallanthus sonchifolius]
MSTISAIILVYASDEDYSSVTPPPSPVRMTPAPPTQQPQSPLVVYQRRNHKRSAPEPAAVREPALPLCPEDTYHWRFIPKMIQRWALQEGISFASRSGEAPRSQELPPLGVPLDRVLITLICRSEKNELHYDVLQDEIYQLQQSQDLDERTAAYVDLIRGDLQATDDVHNNLVDLVLEMNNEMDDLTRRVEVAVQRATEVEETIAAMITGSSDTAVSTFP